MLWRRRRFFRARAETLTRGLVDSIVDSAVQLFDKTHGGFGQAPKFPHSSVIDLMLERQKWPGGASLQTVVEKTLSGMAAGGFHDQIGGGFHRYSVDERWCVPHFEKMSYDNSELLKNYLHGYQALAFAALSRGRRGNDFVGERSVVRSDSAADSTRARTRTRRSMMTAIISRGRSTKCGPCFRRKKRARSRFITT